jgi:hypothetical protein
MPDFHNPKAKALQKRALALRDKATRSTSQQARERVLNEAAKLEDEAESVESGRGSRAPTLMAR